jgi:hypothetical protein
MLEVLAAVSPSEPALFPTSRARIAGRRDSLSSVILILLGWDEERRKLAAALQASGADGTRPAGPREGSAAKRRPSDAAPGSSRLHPGEIEAGLRGNEVRTRR